MSRENLVYSNVSNVFTVLTNFSLSDFSTLFQERVSLQSNVIEKGYKKSFLQAVLVKMAQNKTKLGFAVSTLYVQIKNPNHNTCLSL